MLSRGWWKGSQLAVASSISISLENNICRFDFRTYIRYLSGDMFCLMNVLERFAGRIDAAVFIVLVLMNFGSGISR